MSRFSCDTSFLTADNKVSLCSWGKNQEREKRKIPHRQGRNLAVWEYFTFISIKDKGKDQFVYLMFVSNSSSLFLIKLRINILYDY